MDVDRYEDLESRLLSELSVFSEDETRHLFQAYNIATLGQLLGATRGLARKSFFNTIADGSQKMDVLLRMVPIQLLKKYRNPPASPPPGAFEENAFADENGGDDET